METVVKMLIFIILSYCFVNVIGVTSITRGNAHTKLAYSSPNTPIRKRVIRQGNHLNSFFQKLKNEIRKLKEKPISLEDKIINREHYAMHMKQEFGAFHRLDIVYQGITPKFYSDDKSRFAYLDQGYYATLYDTLKRIPVYSAYTLTLGRQSITDKADTWMRNPGLMDDEQPHLDNYTGMSSVNFHRGHLYPKKYANENILMMKYTNMITNMAPQYAAFNMNTWKRLEYALEIASNKYCQYKGAKIYFLTGVIPSEYIDHYNKISIPSYFWTAVCCDTSETMLHQHKSAGWSFAYIVRNQNKRSQNVDMYFVKDFLQTWQMQGRFIQLFANHGMVQECSYNPVKSVKVIRSIKYADRKDRFFMHGGLYNRSRAKSVSFGTISPLKRPTSA